MNIEKKYFPIEKVEEVKIYDLNKEVIPQKLRMLNPLNLNLF